jgi:hypothetical protein
MEVFTNQQTLREFLMSEGSISIDLVVNPKTEKVFFSTSKGTTGRVSNKITALAEDQYVSTFTPEEGEPSLMLHTQDRTNVKSTFALN